MRARAVAAFVFVALVAASAHADVITAVAPATDDVRKSIVVGPSGQVWEPDGTGTWTRDSEGGVAADVRGATVAGTTLVVAGKSAPLYRRDPIGWIAMRLGERGRTIVGSGPRPSIAIGKTVFVWAGTSWKRVGRTTGNVIALWAANEVKVVAATDTGLGKLAGAGTFAPIPGAPVLAGLGAGGPATWGVTPDGAAYEVATRRIHRPTVGGVPMTVAFIAVGGDKAWALGSTATGPALARFHKGAWTEAVSPPIAADDAPIAFIADTSGALLVVTRAGTIHLAAADGTWSTGTRTEALPVATPGPGPARGR